MAPSHAAGAAHMRSFTGQLPSQVLDGYRLGLDLDFPLQPRPAGFLAVGMGGSAIAADLLSSLTDVETAVPLTVVRGSSLPAYVGPSWVVLLASYSGDTRETLDAYAEAGRRKVPRLVVSSGGELAERAATDGVPCLVVPPGIPPRSAVGYLLGGLLGVLDPLFLESNEQRVRAITEELERRRRSLSAASGGPARLARALHRREPWLYADVAFGPLARRWKTQIEENAKTLAHVDLLPELLHNAVLPWSSVPAAQARRKGVVLIEWAHQDPRVERRFRYLGSLLKRRRANVSRVRLEDPDRLSALLTGLWWGDYVSLFLADLRRVDPLEVAALDAMKEALRGR